MRSLTPERNGVAILSRERPVMRQQGLPGEEELGARLISASIAGLLFITVYCPNGKHLGHPDFPKKLHWLDALARFLKEQHHSHESVVLCGDLNLCPTALDTWNEVGLRGEIFHTDEERARFQSLIEWGLCDLYRECTGRASISWWDYRAGAFHKNQAWHRLPSRHSQCAGARAGRRDRSGISKEERGAGSIRPRAGFRGSGVSHGILTVAYFTERRSRIPSFPRKRESSISETREQRLSWGLRYAPGRA